MNVKVFTPKNVGHNCELFEFCEMLSHGLKEREYEKDWKLSDEMWQKDVTS